MEDDSPNIQEGFSGLLKMAGLMLIGLAIPLGAGVAVREIKRQSGGRAILVCFFIVLAMSALGFLLILASGKILKRYERMRDNSQQSTEISQR